ncbi:MAG: SDR family oxidoreductase [Acidobacteriota bacterium]
MSTASSMSTRRRVLIAGCGDVGCALGTRLAAAGDEVWGLRRNVAALPASIRPLAGDLTTTLPRLPAVDIVVFAAAASERSDEGYRRTYVDGLRRLLDRLEQDGQQPRRVLFTSSTGVYGQDDGSWVDEDSPTEPEAFTGRRMLEAEACLDDRPWPTVAVRFGGIYGPGRTRMIRRLREDPHVPHSPPVWTNRIHRDDCAAVLAHLIAVPTVSRVVVAVDDEPASRWHVASWLRRRLDLEPPIPVDRPPSGAGQNKRCRNTRLKATGYSFLYPSFRDGYATILDKLE